MFLIAEMVTIVILAVFKLKIFNSIHQSLFQDIYIK